ncbi:MAG TPA: protein kinase [Pyrinomonadaceae bacterium]|jgi:S1-C subfamily serine protease/tRNA A-37 threonylcarbamoyl transferase component Bud32
MPAADTVLQGRYRIVRQLGKGGMGAVYEAVDERLHRTVALKETLADTEELKRAFEREARLLANLRHPVLPKVIDHFTEDDGQFLVMEFIPGSDLGELLSRRSRPFSPAEVRRWADDLLDALDYLHTLEPPVIHRDIKPANLKLTAQGKVVLLDFGLAKGAAGQMTRTSSGLSVVGYTLNYAALEQIQGERTSPRSDLYALAATLYHLLTNRAPEDALKRAADILDDKEDPLPPPHTVNRDVPEELSNVLISALSLKPSRRPASAAEMRVAVGEKAAAVVAHAAPVEDDELTRVNAPPVPRSGRLPAIGIGGDPTMVLTPAAGAVVARPNNGGGVGVAARGRATPESRFSAKKWWLIGGGIALALVMAATVFLLWRASGNRAITPATAPSAYDAVPAPFRDALPSVVGLTMQDASGRVTRQASGFFFKSDELVTALPVIEGATRGSVTFVGQTNALEVTAVTGVDREHGLVTLRVARARAPGLALGNRKDTTLNDKVAVVGAGAKAEAAYTPGTISGYGDEDRIEINAQAAPGLAGAPLMNAQGEVIGVVVETPGSGRAAAAPVSYLADLFRSRQQPTSLALAAAKDVLYDWRKHDPLPRPSLDKAQEEKIIGAVARAHQEKAPHPQPTASPEASPQAEGGAQHEGGGSIWDKLQGEMSNAAVSAVAEGSFTASGAKETAYVIDTHSGSAADNDGPKYLAIFSGETYVADYPVPNLSLVVRTFDLNRDGVNELLLGYYYMQMGRAMEWAKLVQLQQGQLRVVKDFGTTYFNACEAGPENNPGLAAAVVYVAPAARDQLPELRVDNYKAACPAEGSDAQWKYTTDAKLPDK